ncbi:hypothetical protein HanIR_Chr06g0262231 [Helianthus annuus]|nr:hypothetical protein HanIR_Chr06g0262231 [Helianthus annuus]
MLSLWFVSSNERKEAFAEARSADADVTTEISEIELRFGCGVRLKEKGEAK